MLLWEVVLEADNRLDLTDGARALAWLAGLGFVVPMVEIGRGKNKRREPQPGCWGEAHAALFAHRLRALRSVAARLKNFRSRGPRTSDSEIGDWEADRVFQHYVGYIRATITRKPPRRKAKGPRLLDRGNFAGLTFAPEVPPEFARDVLLSHVPAADVPPEFAPEPSHPNVPALQVQVLRELEQFFANAFTSLVITGLAPVCGRCGAKLALTPTGRPPRAKYCKACAFAEWQATQTQAAKRKRWKKDKRQQRGK